MTKANRLDPRCDEFREAVTVRKKALNRISLGDYSIRDNVLYKADYLSVPENIEILVDLIREAHDPPAASYPGRHRTLALLKRHYY